MHPIVSKIEDASHIVLIVHKNPDADSLGSAGAMYSHLLRLQKRITLYCASEVVNPALEHLPWFDKMRSVFPDEADLAIAFDCGSLERLGHDLLPFLINIDHHASNDGFGQINLVDVEAVSTTQVLYGLFCKEGIKINPKMATALYAGLLDDSEGFMSAKSDAEAFAMAAELLRCGADARLCNKIQFQTASLAAHRLKGAMLSNTRLVEGARVALLPVERALLEHTGALAVDCEAALNEALYLPTVEVAVMVRERSDGSYKVSLRGDGSDDMAVVASGFGGGGHRHSAGFIFSADGMENALRQVCEAIRRNRPATV